ncbi:MAG: IscS subfamily cysteine desulfurase [Phycisphaerae bacterium]|nr:IscS subfamily cysteine desulfurase [Phycisphaerae bacterium]
MKLPIYFDNAATTRVDPRVFEKMAPFFTETFGNAASRNHVFGWTAEKAADDAREQLGAALGASGKEIVFTSGATESNNLAIKGAAEMYRDKGDHIITCVTEHKAVLDPCKHLEQLGYRVTFLPVDRTGSIDLDELKRSITDKTILISLMAANNEVGTIHPIERIGAIAHERGLLFHTDATQAFGKMPINVDAMNIDLLSASGHKVYGPKGIGLLYVRRKNPRVRLAAQMDGGGHERGMRSGTLNVPGIVGFAEAARICVAEMPVEAPRIQQLRDRLHQGIASQLTHVTLNGHPEHRLPGIVNLSFEFVEGEALMMGMKDIAVSSGSACTSASLEPSYVLRALGVGDELAHSSIRFSLGRFNTQEEVDYVTAQAVAAVKRLRELSPLYEMAQEGVDVSKVQWKA